MISQTELKNSLFLGYLKHMIENRSHEHTRRMSVFVLELFVVLFGHLWFVHESENEGGGCTSIPFSITTSTVCSSVTMLENSSFDLV